MTLMRDDPMNFPTDPRLADLTYEPANFKELAEGETGYDLWSFLRRVDNVIRMETASFLERSAVEPLGPILLAEFGEPAAEDRHKQAVGHMVRQIMERMGYELVQKGANIPKGMFSTGARYQLPSEKRNRSMRITREQREVWLEKTASTPFNNWLKGQVYDTGGKLDLDRLYDVAGRYGIEDIEPYKTLNPGQQRMSIGNRLRKIVPPEDYGQG